MFLSGGVYAKNDDINMQMGRVDGHNPPSSRKDTAFTWTNVYETNPTSVTEEGDEEKKFQETHVLLFFIQTL